MKKYRPIKLWILLLTVIIIGILFVRYWSDGWRQIVVLACTSILFLIFILTTTYYIQFLDNEIVIRHGLSSSNKSYRSSFKTKYINLNEIKDISVNHENKYAIIVFKDENAVMINYGGYYQSSKIADRFSDYKSKLNENCETSK